MAIATQHHPTALPGRPYISPFVAKPAAAVVSFTAEGKVFLYTSANWTSGAAFHYEAYYRATSGTAETRLYDVDAGAAVTNGGLSTTSTSFARERTAALTLVDGNQYTAQFGGAAGGAGEAKGWTIIVVQS